jgi:hypothetical protein
MDICATSTPQPIRIDAEHAASCWLYQEKHETSPTTPTSEAE